MEKISPLEEGLALKNLINVARDHLQNINNAVAKTVTFKPGCRTAAIVRDGVLCELEKRTTESWDQDILETANRYNPEEFSRAFVYEFKAVSPMAVKAVTEDSAISYEWRVILAQARRVTSNMSFSYKKVAEEISAEERIAQDNGASCAIAELAASKATNSMNAFCSLNFIIKCGAFIYGIYDIIKKIAERKQKYSNLGLGALFKDGVELKRLISKCSLRLQEVNNIIAREVTFNNGCKTVSLIRNGIICEVKRYETESWDNGVLKICYQIMPDVISRAFTYKYKPISAKAVKTVMENPAIGEEWRAMIAQARNVTSNTTSFKYRDVNDACLLCQKQENRFERIARSLVGGKTEIQ